MSFSGRGFRLELSVRFAQGAPFLLLLTSELRKNALKTHGICSIQKSDVLCFQVLLSFVSTVFVFPRDPPDFPHSGTVKPGRISMFQAPAGTCAVSKSSIVGFKARIERSSSVRFGLFLASFTVCLSLFSMTYWLRSYHFLFTFSSLFPRAPGPFPPSLAPRG
jgi:hypothetical protein